MYQAAAEPPILRNPPPRPLPLSPLSLEHSSKAPFVPNGPNPTLMEQFPLISTIVNTAPKSLVHVRAYDIIHEGEFQYIKKGPVFSIVDSVELNHVVALSDGKPTTFFDIPLNFNLREIQDFRVIRSTARKTTYSNSITKSAEKKKKAEFDRTQPIQLRLSTVVIQTAAQLKNFMLELIEIDEIGISFEGQNVGRDGIVSWVLIVANKILVPLNIYALTKEIPKVWDKMRKHIFENKKLVKIIHDCRPASDYLFHKHKIQLANVFDTQVADAIVIKNTTGFHPAELKSLSEILPIYNIRIPPDELEYLKSYESRSYKEQSPWLNKPLPKQEYLKYGAIKVKHLQPLMSNLKKRMLSRFLRSVQVHSEIFKLTDSKDELNNPRTVSESLEKIINEDLPE